MFLDKKGNGFLILGLSLSFFGLSVFLNQRLDKPSVYVSKQQLATNPREDFLTLVSFGNKRLISDAMWIHTLLESDEEKYEKKDLNDWMYLRFRTISELDPKFYENYLFGGIYLSIIKDDTSGAALIYEAGLKQFPIDYRLNYNAGFNYYFEMGDFERGFEKLVKLEHMEQTPMSIRFIINKLRLQQTNDYDAAMAFLQERLKDVKDGPLKDKITKDIYALKADHDLDCLNKNKQDCSRIDAYGEAYKKENFKWKAKREYLPYKIHLKAGTR